MQFPPSVEDFQEYFFRDFPYGTTLDKVTDDDICKAFKQAFMVFNTSLWGGSSSQTVAFLYLSAHFMVMDLRASSQGIAGTYAWLEASKGAGSVNQAFTIPQSILDHPTLGMLSKTTYGAKYLELALPHLVGQMFMAQGQTQP